MSDQTVPDTEPPPANHGWLEQFEHFGAEAFEKLESIVKTGVSSSERITMIKVAIKLLALAMGDAKEEDFSPEHKAEVESLIIELEKLYTSLA